MDKIEAISTLVAWVFAMVCFFKSGKYYDRKEYARACFWLLWGAYILQILSIHYK